MINPIKHKEYDNHELVEYFHDKKTGLKGILAIHSTIHGHAVGGTRYFSYVSENDALEDVLRLSKAMSYKCALAGLKYGGGKCVLIAPSNRKKSKKYIEAYGKVLKKYSKKFFTGEDVGMNQNDIEELSKITPNIIGTTAKSGDPSGWAALSTYYSMRGVLKFLYNNPSLKGKKIVIKGLGNVGMKLAQLAYNDGAELIVSDIDKNKVNKALKLFKNISVIHPNKFDSQECDIFAPCSLGKDITKDIAKKIKAKIICGVANNQLETKNEGITLFKRGIIYVPDYVVNSGGLINVVAELSKNGYNKKSVLKKCKNIESIIIYILKESKKTNTAPNIIADNIAKRALIKK